jgi:hypothetical protein
MSSCWRDGGGGDIEPKNLTVEFTLISSVPVNGAKEKCQV